MKNTVRTLTLSIVLAACAVVAYGQQDFGPKWGPTPEEQQENVKVFQFYRDAYQNKEYDEALEHLSTLLENAPAGSQNIYIYGIEIYRDKILKATSRAERNQYVDELMNLYDLRAENFGSDPQRGRPYILEMKAEDFLIYKAADREGIHKLYRDAIEAYGDRVEARLIIQYFNELTSDYKGDVIELDEYLGEYERLEPYFALAHNQEGNVKDTYDALFVSSGAANCEVLEKMYEARFAANPDDVAMLEKGIGLMARGKCESELFGQMGDKLYTLKPTAALAINLADYYDRKGQSSRSLEYLRSAIANAEDPEDKVNLAIQASGSELSAGNARNAAEFAREAIAINPNSGLAYFFLAQAYNNGTGQCSGFDRQAAYWLVYDTLSRARSLLSGDDRYIRDIDAQMGSLRAGFPSQEECFFRGLSNGQSYTVRCGWVSGSTTVRHK